MKILKGISVTLLALMVLLCNVVYAADKRPLRNVTVFYCMDNKMLEVWSDEGDLDKGQEKITNLITKKFKKRFNVMEVKRIEKNADGEYNADEVMSIPAGQIPLIIEAAFTGTHTDEVEFNNAFGGRRVAEVPVIDMSYKEFFGVSEDGKNRIVTVDEWKPWLRAGTLPLGFDAGILVGGSNPRTFAKDAVEYLIENRGRYSPPNYYVEAEKYEKYTAGYYLDTSYFLAKEKEAKVDSSTKTAEAADTTKAE